MDELLHATALPAVSLLDDERALLAVFRRAFDELSEREHAPEDLRARARVDRAFWQSTSLSSLNLPVEWAKVCSPFAGHRAVGC
jgi:hypothetical protein